MAESEEDWIRKRAYALWEEEGYPADKDREHWERAKLEYATLHPTASKSARAATAPKKAASPPKTSADPAPKANGAPKATRAPKAAKPSGIVAKGAVREASSEKTSRAKATPKVPAATAAAEPGKKRSRKLPAGE